MTSRPRPLFVKTRNLLLAALAAATLAACAPKAILVTEVAKAAFENRETEVQVVDAKIKVGVVDRLSEIDKSLVLDLSVDVWRGRVMLTGALSDSAQRNSAVRAARKDDRIREFFNDVMLVTAQEQEMRRDWKDKAKSAGNTAGQVASDLWIETKISAQLLSAEGVGSTNYRWRSVLGNVFLLGEASSATELKTVIGIINETEGVKGLKSHAVVAAQ